MAIYTDTYMLSKCHYMQEVIIYPNHATSICTDDYKNGVSWKYTLQHYRNGVSRKYTQQYYLFLYFTQEM